MIAGMTDSPLLVDRSRRALHTEPQQLSPQVLKLWWVTTGIWTAIVLVLGGVAEVILWVKSDEGVFRLPLGVLAGLAVLLLGVLPLLMVPLSYRRWTYQIREEDVLIESGVVWRVRRSVPRSRVQHVDIKSGPLDRWLGVVEVELFTAGSMGAVASIPGLSPVAAEELRSALVEEGTEDHDGV
jgi:membrane protein YdbS with pleckstrin-like domain